MIKIQIPAPHLSPLTPDRFVDSREVVEGKLPTVHHFKIQHSKLLKILQLKKNLVFRKFK